MSIIVKKVHGDEYVYFQTYELGRKKEEYVGRADNPNVWERALKLYAKYKSHEVSDFRQRITEEMTRRRLDVPETVFETPMISEIFGLGRPLRIQRKRKAKEKGVSK
jgi:hypothetical protein